MLPKCKSRSGSSCISKTDFLEAEITSLGWVVLGFGFLFGLLCFVCLFFVLGVLQEDAFFQMSYEGGKQGVESSW